MDTGTGFGETPTRGPDEKFCTSCGSVIKRRAVVCPQCGVPQGPPQAGKNKVAAGVLGILLGSIGVHKFYLGKIGQGIIYVLFCWTGIPGLVGLIEGIIYLTMSDEEWAYKYPPNFY